MDTLEANGINDYHHLARRVRFFSLLHSTAHIRQPTDADTMFCIF